ncbi:MAG: hypothetical protein ABSB69_12760 [Solirubrobacteraceae bacterium]
MAIENATAATALSEYAGLSEPDASTLLDAILVAAHREALELIAGDEPVPSSLSDLRSLRLRHITECAKRALKPREVEVILRASPSAALSALRRLNATYPRAVDQYMKVVVKETSNSKATGSSEAGYRYEVSFDELTALEYAYQVLQRNGLAHDVKLKRGDQILDLPREIGGRNLLDVLGIKKPKP